jgi:hypothetical protein
VYNPYVYPNGFILQYHANMYARLHATVDFPTPPLQEETKSMLDTVRKFAGVGLKACLLIYI